MRLSELHEDYSGDNPEEWFENPNTRIHEAEWILEASATYLDPTEESGNVGGDTDSTGWDGKPVDYVQGYGLVDARRAVGIALTLERLRDMCDDPAKIDVRDAIAVYDGQGVPGTVSVISDQAEVKWSGEYSRYNDQSMNPLSLVNQTKFVEIPEGATSATITMSYAGLDTTLFQAADLAFTIDTNGDGNVDHQSSLSVLDGGTDVLDVSVGGESMWTFNIIGRGVKIPRPFQGTNYVELRVEYEIGVVFDVEGNGSYTTRPLNAVYAPLFPGQEQVEGPMIETYRYDLRVLELPVEEESHDEDENGSPLVWVLIILILGALGATSYLYYRKRKMRGKVPDDVS